MEKSDPVPPRARASDLVDQRHAARIQALEHAVDVLHPQRQVMERVAALFQELLQAGVAARTDELERRAVGEVEEGRVDFLRRHVLLRALTVAGVGLAFGVGAGAVVSALVVSVVTVTAGAGTPVPPLALRFYWPLVALAVACVAAVSAAASFVAVRRPR